MRVFQGRYRVVQAIARGGHSEIYLCEDARLPGRLWAVKQVDLRQESHQDARAFEQEAALLAQLDHPRIPVLADYFVEGPYGYLVCEFLDGPSLHQWVERKGAVSEAKAIDWAIQIAEVLAYLHQRTPPLIHRDLKPQNLIVGKDGLHLIDFGLAREGGGVSGREGSVSFTAPEQFQADHRPEPSCDIYSLGAILYYLLMRLPPAPTGGQHRLRFSRPDLLPDTEELILQCLQEDPQQRLKDVSQVLSGLQFLAARLPAPEATLAWSTRPEVAPAEALTSQTPAVNRKVLGRALLPLLLLLPLAGLFIWQQAHLPVSRGTPTPRLGQSPRELTWEQVKAYLDRQQWAEAEGALRGLLANEPGLGWAHLALAQLQLLKQTPEIPRVPLLLPLGGQEREHVDWILQGVALGQQDEGRFLFDLVDTRSDSLLEVWQELLQSSQPPLCLGPFGTQDTLLLAPLASASGVPLLSIGSSDPRATDFPAVYPLAFPHWSRIAALLDQAVAQCGEQGLILASGESKAMATSAQLAHEHLEKRMGKQIPLLTFVQEEDPASLVSRVRESSARWIYLSDNLPGRSAECIAHLRRGGIKVPVLCVFHPASRGFVSALKDVAGEVWLVEPLWQQRNPEFVERCRRQFSDLAAGDPGWTELSVDWNNALGYDVARIASGIWQPELAKEGYLKALATATDYQGLLGTYHLKKKSFAPFAYRYRVAIVQEGRLRIGPVLEGER